LREERSPYPFAQKGAPHHLTREKGITQHSFWEGRKERDLDFFYETGKRYPLQLREGKGSCILYKTVFGKRKKTVCLKLEHAIPRENLHISLHQMWVGKGSREKRKSHESDFLRPAAKKTMLLSRRENLAATGKSQSERKKE